MGCIIRRPYSSFIPALFVVTGLVTDDRFFHIVVVTDPLPRIIKFCLILYYPQIIHTNYSTNLKFIPAITNRLVSFVSSYMSCNIVAFEE